ncbi:MAG: DUF4412 domain-containing protein [Desulfohalobiaceae bacterium]|nr:DUF4412 domain-containing protein [Desulfohalobiaceae bacterium]
MALLGELFWVTCIDLFRINAMKDTISINGTRTLVSQGILKSIPADLDDNQMILDLRKGTIIVLDQQKMTASQGTVDEYCTAMQKIAGMMTQRMQQMKGKAMSDMPDSPYPDQSLEQQVRVEKLGPGGDIAGYATQKYEVYVNDELIEEVWSSKDEELLGELGEVDAMIRFQACASQMMGGNSVESDPKYKRMLQSGWMLKSIEHEDGYAEVIVEVQRIEQKSIPSSEFEIPAGYTRMSLGQLFGME